MPGEPLRALDPVIRSLRWDILQAPDQQIARIVALVDAMPTRGAVDQLLVPLRQRLALLNLPRPLRFPRLIFQPLTPLIVAAARWRLGQQAIPRTVIMPIADHIRLVMGAAGSAIETGMAGQTTTDTDVVTRLGRSLWPVAAKILAGSAIPRSWPATDLADTVYRPLADIVAAVLAEAATLQTLCSESATGLLPPRPDAVAAILSRGSRLNPAALPMMIALLLHSVPQAAGLLPPAQRGAIGTALHAAMDGAGDILLRQLNEEDCTGARIIKASLSDAGTVTSRIVMLLAHLADAAAKPARREQLRLLRRRLDAACRARFVSGLRNELLTPLQCPGVSVSPAEMRALETAARGLRLLATEASAVANGPAYGKLLGQAVEAIKNDSMRDKLALADRLRLVEILAGPDAALAMLDQPR
jgi:hypothetical protein